MYTTRIVLLFVMIPIMVFSQNGPFNFTHNNIQREYYLHIPNNLPTNSPIVYVLHGWGGDGANMMYLTGFNILSDQNNFAVCYPTALVDGDNGNSGLTSWNTSGLSDVNFLHALNDSLTNHYQFNQNKIFATGFSYGAEMSFHLARCQISDVFDAIAPLAGSIFEYMNVCDSLSTHIPVFVLHGTNDNVVNFNGGYFPNYGPYLSAPDIVDEFVTHNLCVLDTSYTLLDLNNDNNTTDVIKYNNFNTGNKVWFYKINNGTHSWFDVAPWGNDDFWASDEIWNFFSQIGNNITISNNNYKSSNKKIVKIVNSLGQENKNSSNRLLFYLYDNGSVDKKIILK